MADGDASSAGSSDSGSAATPSSGGAGDASSGLPAPSGGLRDSTPEVSSIFEGLGSSEEDFAPQPTKVPEARSAAPPPAQPEVAQPVPAPVEAVPPPPPGAPLGAPPPQAPETPFSDEVIKQLQSPQNREALINHLSKQFTFSPEELQGLATDAAPVLQRMAARILHASAVHALKQVQRALGELPRRLDNYTAESREAEGHEDKFYQMWPGLRHPGYNSAIQAAAHIAKSMPGQTQEGVYLTAGRMVAAQYGLSLSPVGSVGVAPSGQPQTVVGRRSAPFSPAATGGGPATPSGLNGGTASAWEGLGLDFD